jgi:hypothetical protein
MPFMPAFVVGSGLLALWIDTRRPSLAPESVSRRFLAAVCALIALQAIPVFHGSVVAVYATVFGLVLPVLVCAFLAAVWLLRALRDVQAAS